MSINDARKKILVGLSGGVDSSVTAYLLKEAGHDVSCGFIKVWQPDFMECSQEDDRLSAVKVSAELALPFETVGLEDEYKTSVVDYMIDEYRKGRTPNPDVLCNKEVKFGAFLSHALEEGFDSVATGHYAQNIFDTKTGEWELHRGNDENKDQTYFLWTLKQAQLSHILFPIGHLTKPEVRAIAKEARLLSAERKESQGLCFVGHINLKEFLSHFVVTNKGLVLSTEGEVIGEHDGALFYTLGQRHGFTTNTFSPDKKPYFVVAKNMEKNTITVSDDTAFLSSDYDHSSITIEKTNFINHAPVKGDRLMARLRHRQALFPVTVTLVDEHTQRAVVALETPLPHLPPGQALVLYEGARCVGGGFIVH